MLKYEVMAMNGFLKLRERAGEAVHNFFTDEEGDTNFISIIVVLVIVMALAIVFRNNIAAVVNAMWKKITGDAGAATGTTINSQNFS